MGFEKLRIGLRVGLNVWCVPTIWLRRVDVEVSKG